MSKGTIKLVNPNLEGKGDWEKPIIKLLAEFVPNMEVSVEDELWKKSIAEVLQSINENKTLNEGQVSKLTQEIDSLQDRLGSNTGNITDSINQLIERIANLENKRPTELIVKIAQQEPYEVGLVHKKFQDLLSTVSQHLNVYLVGPAGSGKTHAAKQCAEALHVPFYFTGSIANEYKLTGYMDAQGQYVTTEFRKAYEDGGLFLFDEIDGSFPQAVLAFNAALANDFMDFPDKQVKRHKDFYCIAAANTIGLGADRQYVGRNQLDAASLDRFVFLNWPYDVNLEERLSGNAEWTKYVRMVRQIQDELHIRHIISPRASIYGAKLLEAGIEREKVEEMVLWKGLPQNDIDKIKKEMMPIEITAPCNLEFLKGKDEEDNYIKNNGQVVQQEDKIGYYWEWTSDNHSRRRGYYGNFFVAPINGKITYKIQPQDDIMIEEGTIIAIIEKIYE